MRYTPEQIAAIAENLRAMPAVEKPKKQDHSRQEAVKLLAKEITALQNRGYTLVQIAESLRGNGLVVATPTLKSYLQRAKPAKTSTKKAMVKTTPSTQIVSPAQSAKTSKTSKSHFEPRPDTKDI